MVTKWIHLHVPIGDQWVLPIWGAVNAANAAKKVPPLPKMIGELGLHVSRRLDLLPQVIQRINQGANALYEEAKKHKPEHVYTEDVSSAFAFPIAPNLMYQLIVDIDAFLFEVNSCVELMRKLFQRLHAHVGCPLPDEPCKITAALKDALAKHGVDADWFKILDRNRNFAAHGGTPYLAVDISNDGAWHLLIMKENLIKFDDKKKFFRLAELQVIDKGFRDAKVALQKYLIALFE